MSSSRWPRAASPGCGSHRNPRSDRSPPDAVITDDLSPTMSALVLATRNDHKLRELREALPGIEIDPLPPEVELPPETGDTFAENALGKAHAAHEATSRTAIADDSGIAAYGLGGRPGVR